MQVDKTPTIRVVSVCDEPPVANYYCYEEFLLSLRSQNVLPLILGTKRGEYLGLSSKPKLLLKAIERGWIKEDYIIFCDSYDLVFQRPIMDSIRLFETYESDIVISGELNCFPTTYKNEFDAFWGDKSPSAYKYINSGFLMGKRDAVLALLQSMNLEAEPDDFVLPDGSVFHSNDQELFQRAWTYQRLKISIDVHRLLSWCMCNVPASEVQYTMLEQVVPIDSDIAPLTIHWNGPAKTQGTMEPILKHLRLR